MEDRFKVIYYQQPKALEDSFKVIVDTVTGVNYMQLLLPGGGGTSLAPLFNSDGKVVVFSQEEIAKIKNINNL